MQGIKKSVGWVVKTGMLIEGGKASRTNASLLSALFYQRLAIPSWNCRQGYRDGIVF